MKSKNIFGAKTVVLIVIIGITISAVLIGFGYGRTILLGAVLGLIIVVVITKLGVHFTVWSMLCITVPLVMFRVPIFSEVYKITPAIVIAPIVVVTWILYVQRKNLPLLRLYKPGTLAATLFIGFSLMSILWNQDNTNLALSNIPQYIFGLFIYVLFSSVVRNQRDLEFAIRLILLSLGITLACLTYYYLGYLDRDYISVWFRSDIGESGKNMLSYMIALFFPLVISHVILVRSSKIIKILEWGIAASFVIALLFSTSRATYISTAFGIGLMMFFLPHRYFPRLLLGLGVVALLLVLYQPSEVIINLKSVFNMMLFEGGDVGMKTGSIDYRYELIRTGLKIFIESPLWGKGFGSYSTFEASASASHNDYARVLAETGAIGFFLYLFFFLSHIIPLIRIGWARRRNPQWFEIGLLVAIATLAVQLLFINADTLLITWIVFGLAASFLAGGANVAPLKTSSRLPAVRV